MALASSHPLSPQFLSTSFQTKLRKDHSHQLPIWFNTPRLRYCLRLPATRRFSNYSQESDNLVSDPRNWSGRIARDYDDFGTDDDADDDEEGEDEDRSLDLLVRFVQNVFRKISRRARKAVRSVLPLSISTKLVGFSVNGIIVLAFLWVLKAFLEVVCTIGSVVFVSILLIRGIWSGVFYLQESRNHRTRSIDDENTAWTGTLPAT